MKHRAWRGHPGDLVVGSLGIAITSPRSRTFVNFFFSSVLSLSKGGKSGPL